MTQGHVRGLAEAARRASIRMAQTGSDERLALIERMASELRAGRADIIAANAEDMAHAVEAKLSDAIQDRLRLDEARIDAIAKALDEIAVQPDPLAKIGARETRPNGLVIERRRLPLGLIAMIYESRPNVTADAAALCLKAGNAVLLRGGSEARASNAAIAARLHRALAACDLPEAAVSIISDPDRAHVLELLQLADLIDLAIPRGGEALIRFVAEHARVPVIKHYKGVCHLYVDQAADLGKAWRLLIDGKTSRPGVCNALETLLVHQAIATDFLPGALGELIACGVDVRGCDQTRAFNPTVTPAAEADFDAEFLAPIIAVRVVDDLQDALAHIARYGSDHTEVIVSEDRATADAFIRGTRSSAVMVNASSRFNDGGELGLGAEIGISTTRLHAYGPMGADSLTIERFVVLGEGQIRHPDLQP